MTFNSDIFYLISTMLVLTSCVGKGPREMAADAVVVPARWQQGSSSPKPLDVALWWRRFHDPVLNDLIAGALQSSPTVRSALEKVTEYRARRGVESANLFPSLAGNQSGRGARTKSGITDVITTSESYKASFDVNWQVDLFGKQYQTLKAATADLEQIGEIFYGAQVTLAADVATAYIALRSAEAQLSVVQRSLGTRGETVQLTQWREQAGTGDAENGRHYEAPPLPPPQARSPLDRPANLPRTRRRRHPHGAADPVDSDVKAALASAQIFAAILLATMLHPIVVP